MSEKVLGFYEKDAGITCAKCYCVYCGVAKCPAPDCGEVNKEDIITLNRSELVPVRLKKESVDLKWLERWVDNNAWVDIKEGKDGTAIRGEAHIYKKDLLCAVRAKAEACEK